MPAKSRRSSRSAAHAATAKITQQSTSRALIVSNASTAAAAGVAQDDEGPYKELVEIIDGVFMGACEAARNVDLLGEKGITRLICCDTPDLVDPELWRWLRHIGKGFDQYAVPMVRLGFTCLRIVTQASEELIETLTVDLQMSDIHKHVFQREWEALQASQEEKLGWLYQNIGSISAGMFATGGGSSKGKSAENTHGPTTFAGVQADSIELAKMLMLFEQIAQQVQTADDAEHVLAQRLSGGSDHSYFSCDSGSGGSGSDD
eukprot:COSAG06_NODE_6386_length_2955_cov_3.667017_1_plen_261_part_00